MKPKTLKRFYVVNDGWFRIEICRVQKSTFIKSVGVICTENFTAYRDIKFFDKRKPNLFKGDLKLYQSSKTYQSFGKNDNISTKGLNMVENDVNKDKFH